MKTHNPNTCNACGSNMREIDHLAHAFRLVCSECKFCACDECWNLMPKRNWFSISPTVCNDADKKLEAVIASVV